MPTKTPSWWVLGQGALGLMLASRLQQHHFSVALKLRGSATPALATKQYHYYDYTGTPRAGQVPVRKSHSIPIVKADSAPPEVILAAIKAYDVAAFIAQYKTQSWGQKATPPPQLIMSYNGMLDDEQRLFDGLNVRHLSTTQAAYVDGDTVHHTGLGESFISAPLNVEGIDATTDTVVKALQTSIPPLTPVTDVTRIRWLKLGVNAVINPLTAIHRVPNGALAEPRFLMQKQALCEEFSDIAAAAGVRIPVADVMQKVSHVIESTAGNFSSMLQDVQLQRRTEIDYVTGFLVRKAAQFNIAAPTHQALLRQFKNEIQS